MDIFIVEYALWLVAATLAIPPATYVCWRAFVRAGPDARAARRWTIWFRIAVSVFLFGAIFEMAGYASLLSGLLGGVYSPVQARIAWHVGDLIKSNSPLAIFISLVETAYFLASVRNNGVPVRHSGWSRILAYVVTSILSILLIALFGLWLNHDFGLSNNSPAAIFQTGYIGLAFYSAALAISFTIVGISTALLVKTRRDAAHLVPAAKLFLTATVLFMLPHLYTIISFIVQVAIVFGSSAYGRNDPFRWLIVARTFIFWLSLSACLFVQLRLRKLKTGVEDANKERSPSV